MRRYRDLFILITLFATLVIFTIIGPGNSRDDAFETRPTTYSSAPGGALALLRWLNEDLGFEARRLEYTDFALDERTDAFVILSPSEPINRTQADVVLRWVADGGTLILADDRPQLFVARNAILDELEIAMNAIEDTIERAAVVQPVLDAPPLQSVLANTSQTLEFNRADVAPLVAQPDAPILVGLKLDFGYIYISSTSYPFTNEGLRDEQNSALVLNLLRRVPRGGQVLFNEYHHGFVEPPSLRNLVMSSPWGWGLLYAIAIVAGYLILTGRRFGQPVPVRVEVERRSSAEYVESMADLFQRGGKQHFILLHYHQAFKRRLARPYGINPRL
ncbi:MAG: DUF4350 domain-containing protein, partial [Chloroflexales bacterium]|nr:DUF4350 domain-containing protein [Chloroflexales bacterium]